jgi:serine/threonine protein kinase/regulator of sirC expression with transglutaminase-like and TPR domain
LGQGGFAAVFEAKDRLLNRRVAIKQLLLKRTGDERVVKRFVQEARVAASLEHPNVVTIYSLRIDGNLFYIIMEYLPHGSLQNLIDKRGRLSAEQAIRLTTGICEGLAKLHEYGVIHRDIKAQNILLAADGRPKIIDFGIAHVPEMMGGMALTQVGFQPSTLIFSSPEQVRGKAVDQRSDVYQVGQLLYYMLTGQHYIDLKALQAQIKAFGKTNQFQTQAKLYALLEAAICDDMPRDMQKLWREVGVLAGVVEKAMAKDPQDRFASALDFAAALKAINISAGSDDAVEKKTYTMQDSRTYNRRGLAHVNMRNYEQAIYDYSKAIELDRHYAEAYNNRSAAHLMMDNYAKAMLDCNWTLELAPHFVSAYINLGIAHTGLRQYQQALKDYARALEIDPNNLYAFYNRGNTRIWMRDFEGAIEDFNTTIRLDPEFVAAYVNRGVAYTELREYEPALTNYSEAIELNPNYVYAFFNRANLYREMGQYAEAIADYNKVTDLNPQHYYAYENRGDCYAALGQDTQATADYARMAENTWAITPKRMNVARSMLMPATPLDFLTPKHDSLFLTETRPSGPQRPPK